MIFNRLGLGENSQQRPENNEWPDGKDFAESDFQNIVTQTRSFEKIQQAIRKQERKAVSRKRRVAIINFFKGALKCK